MRELDWPKPPKWMEAASCATIGTDLWFPEQGPPSRDALRICAACPVATQCLAYAKANDERSGVWGGKSMGQRKSKLADRMGREAA